ncbi:uncharacterized protein N7503_000438 [Penicillium pulvis]|uniref:uncharacterized protein n=1 Tax=Penicillium pulvis TaxID=1562058 RepID=UPI0025477A74|nr:uncharacterized protein N7503_000438 [Penicillium pulvis]KAJ5813688.1 hypothetical protein N7503_000438 [Penicillium pulvis]
MAEAHVNTLFGAAGFLGQLVQNTLSAFELWDKVEKATESADRYIVRLQFLRARLHWWTLCWGLLDDETSPSVVADPRFEIYSATVANYLQLISKTLRNLTACEDTASVFKRLYTANASSSLSRLVMLLKPLSNLQSTGTENVNNDASNLRERLEWALQNGKAMENLKLLSVLIQDLEGFLPAPDSDLNGTILVNPALRASALKLRWLSRQSDFDVFTISIAELKATSLSQVNEFKLSPLDKSSRLTGSLDDLGEVRAGAPYLAKYNGVAVLVGRKQVPIMTDHTVLRARIEKLVRMLSSSQNIKELRTPPCLGYMYTSPGEGTLSHTSESCTYEILYSLDEQNCYSLRHALFKKWKISLRTRYDIARSLARSILYLHAVEWLHKGIRSSNVVFSTNKDLPRDSEKSESPKFAVSGLPYLVGFEYSRINSRDEGTEKTIDTSDHNLYRHPDTQGEPSTTDSSLYLGEKGRFTKNHDIFSLGVILVELGVLKPAHKIERDLKDPKKDYKNAELEDRPQKFKEHLLELVSEVENNMGPIYANVTSQCLAANFYRQDVTMDQEGAVAFYRDVIAQLGKCKV